jgi:hypothetical protein
MKYRKLRIAYSVGWGMLCLLLVAFWMRSYWWVDAIFYSSDSNVFEIESVSGHIRIFSNAEVGENVGWYYANMHLDHRYVLPLFEWDNNLPAHFIAGLPHWVAAALTPAFALAPWFTFRFSLRTLLIGVTVIAVLLGASIYSVR